MGRPRKWADNAERQAAFRSANARVDLVIPKETGDTIESIADHLNVTKNALVTAMLRFALTNHNWRSGGVWMDKK